jgi:hypothetical protein
MQLLTQGWCSFAGSMPGGKDGQGREPPVPESPLWLPSIQPDRSGRTSPVQKVRQIAGATGTLRKEPGQLYDASTLLAEPAGGLGATGGLKVHALPTARCYQL